MVSLQMSDEPFFLWLWLSDIFHDEFHLARLEPFVGIAVALLEQRLVQGCASPLKEEKFTA